MDKLEPIESSSELWLKLSEHFAERRDILRAKNDNLSLDLNETLYTRGQISVYKELLRLAQPTQPIIT